MYEQIKNDSNIEWDYERDNIYSMSKADIMISDFSGIIYDYTFLCNKPVMYVNAQMNLKPYDAYDLSDNGKSLWQFETLKKIGIKLEESDFGRIKEVIQNASDSSELEAARQKAKAEAWMHIGKAGDNIADYMIQTVENQKANKEEKLA